MDSTALRRGLLRAGVLVILGLVVEGITLFWSHPTAFLFFAGLGMGLVVLGLAQYLWVVLRAQPPDATSPAEAAAD